MASTDLANMTSRLVGSPYITQEVCFLISHGVELAVIAREGHMGRWRTHTTVGIHRNRRCDGVRNFELITVSWSQIPTGFDTRQHC